MRGEEEYRRSHGLGARSQKFRAHSERIQSGYRAMVSRGGLQALPQAWSAVSKSPKRTPSGYRADTERWCGGGLHALPLAKSDSERLGARSELATSCDEKNVLTKNLEF